MSSIRLVTKDDYAMLADWWTRHGWNAVPQKILPPLGIIANETAAGWLYMDNGGTGVAMMEWLVTNPDAAPRDAVRSLKAVIEFLQSEAKRLHYDVILTTCKQESLARLLENSGFARSDSEMIHLIGGLT